MNLCLIYGIHFYEDNLLSSRVPFKESNSLLLAFSASANGDSNFCRVVNSIKMTIITNSNVNILILHDIIFSLSNTKMKDCCKACTKNKKCVRKSDKKVFSLPRKFSKRRCLGKKPKGFTMRASCAPFKNCKNIH